MGWWYFGRQRGRGVVSGDGAFSYRVVGTLAHQAALEEIGGARSHDGYHIKCAALLLPEPLNPYDHYAIRVIVHEREVGHLDRVHAREFGRVLRRIGFADAACEAEIVGGWNRGRVDGGYVGLRLNALLPFRLSVLMNGIARASSRANCAGLGRYWTARIQGIAECR